MAQRAFLTQQAHRNIAKAQQLEKESHDKRVKFTRKFKVEDLVAYRKEKRCERKGKFRAKYVDSYTITKADEERHKFQVAALHPEIEKISYMVPHFDLMSCKLNADLTNINLQVGKFHTSHCLPLYHE